MLLTTNYGKLSIGHRGPQVWNKFLSKWKKNYDECIIFLKHGKKAAIEIGWIIILIIDSLARKPLASDYCLVAWWQG